MITAAWVCLFSPLATAVLITLGGSRMSRRASGYISTLSVAVSFVAAAIAFFSILATRPKSARTCPRPGRGWRPATSTSD